MRFVDNDRWAGTFPLDAGGRWTFTIEALADPFRSWLADLDKRVAAGQAVDSELLEGAALVRAAAERAAGADAAALRAYADRMARTQAAGDAIAAAREPALAALMTRHLDRREATPAERVFEVVADRERARFAAWYEFFPRSGVAGRHGTFKDAEAQLERAAALGFDVVYLPPIHPVGRTHRKGRNNTLTAGRDDPGSPWAIGGEAGGHTAVHPELGTLEDFDRFVERAGQLGLEVALDFAIQCSPDHPWVREHPEWFFRRPDGTIKYAENPPKKYQDVYPVNFGAADPRPLWEEMRRVVEFWVGHGVRTFRVDNPHTKPVKFWEWLIREIQARHPDVIFLAEAFTRPKMMKVLAKAGFTQSYTYFTWRNEKQELIDYFTEITRPPVADYFRGHLWPNTPDILHATLQKGGRPAFQMRLVMAATLSSLYGIYSGYELAENVPYAEGSEEYLNSEKYELKVRDWDAPGQHHGSDRDRQSRAPRAPRPAALHESAILSGRRSPHPVLRQDDARPSRRRLRRRQPRPLRYALGHGRRCRSMRWAWVPTSPTGSTSASPTPGRNGGAREAASRSIPSAYPPRSSRSTADRRPPRAIWARGTIWRRHRGRVSSSMRFRSGYLDQRGVRARRWRPNCSSSASCECWPAPPSRSWL